MWPVAAPTTLQRATPSPTHIHASVVFAACSWRCQELAAQSVSLRCEPWPAAAAAAAAAVVQTLAAQSCTGGSTCSPSTCIRLQTTRRMQRTGALAHMTPSPPFFRGPDVRLLNPFRLAAAVGISSDAAQGRSGAAAASRAPGPGSAHHPHSWASMPAAAAPIAASSGSAGVDGQH